MPRAIVIHSHGGPEVMQWEEVEVPPPGPGQARVRITAVGLNFVDVYHRTGLYPGPLPSRLGSEAAGVVESVGPGVTAVAPGDRVVHCSGPHGAYAEVEVVPADVLVRIPQGVDDATAAAALLKGITAEYLLQRTYKVVSGDTIVFHAASGGVGSIAVQWARNLGVRVIGTVSTKEKADRARALGCAEVILHGEDLPPRVRELTHGKGVPVVYDSIGKDTWQASLACLAPRGMLVCFGQSSGPVPPIDPRLLHQGSFYLTRPTLRHYVGTRQELEASASALFDRIARGTLRIDVGQTFPLARAADAHRALENRATIGSTVLVP